MALESNHTKKFASKRRIPLPCFTFFLSVTIFILPINAHSYIFPTDYNRATATAGVYTYPNDAGGNINEANTNIGSRMATTSYSLSGSYNYWVASPGFAWVEYDGNASAGVFASTGKLRVSANSSGGAYYDFGGGPVEINSWGAAFSASAELLDTLHFSGATEPFPVELEWVVDGFLSPNGVGGSTMINYAIGGPDAFITGTNSPTEWSDDISDGAATLSRTIWMDPSAGPPSWLINLNPSARWDPLDLSIRGSLSVTVYEGYANFMNTGQFSITVPEGITFESASGVFLTETSQVPIPGAIWLLGTGLVGILGFRKKFMK
jgi:hypothetical protein